MTQNFVDQIFDGWAQFDSGRTYSALKFVGCRFQSCSVSLSVEDLSKRARLTNAEFHKCSVAACGTRAVIVEDVLIDVLKTSGMFQTWAAVFKHVTLKGKIDRVMLSPFFHPGYPDSRFQQVIAKANADYYASVDWALDISEAEFKDFDCRGVPPQLVRRDPETQVMVKRDRALTAGDAITAGGDLWASILRTSLRDAWLGEAMILIAPKRHRQFKELAAGLQELRRAGIAEPD